MKTWIKMTMSAALISLAAGAWAFPFWLEAPTRSNPRDPRNPQFRGNAVPGVPGPVFSATPSASPTSTPTPWLNSPTPTPSATPSPSLTVTLTPVPKWYDGDTPGSTLVDGSFGADTAASGMMGVGEFSAGGGANGSANYMSVTFSASTGTWWGRAFVAPAGAPEDHSADNALRFYVRVPSSGCANSFSGAVQLSTNGAWPNDRSRPVTINAYVAGNGGLAYDAWTEVTIPLAAFVGPNWEGGNFPAAALSSVTQLAVLPWFGMFDNTGALPGSLGTVELQLDEVQFVSLPIAPAENHIQPLFDDFENPAMPRWFTNRWEVTVDGLPCTPQTSLTFPGMGQPPIDSPGGPDSACRAAHLQGFLNTNFPCDWTPPLSDPWPLVRMMVDLHPTGDTSIDLSNNTLITGLPPTGAAGLRLKMRHGTASPGQVYLVQILRTATYTDWNNYHFRVADSDLSTTWTTFNVDFPPDGQAASTMNHTSDTTSLFWGQEDGWGNQVPWARNDFDKLIIRVKNGGDFDLWVDDIEFY